MKDLPYPNESIVVRTDFSDEAAWERVCAEIDAPVGEFRAYVLYVSDPAYDGLGIGELTTLARRDPSRRYLFVVDRVTLTDPDHPIVALDLAEEPGRTFRVIPREMWSVENNLSISNMDFWEFADRVNAEMLVAHQQILHDSEHPSHVVLPLLD